MTYGELKEKLEGLTKAQLNQEVYFYGEEFDMNKCLLETAEEDYLYDVNCSDTECHTRSACKDWEGKFKVKLKAGDMFLKSDFRGYFKPLKNNNK